MRCVLQYRLKQFRPTVLLGLVVSNDHVRLVSAKQIAGTHAHAQLIFKRNVCTWDIN